MVKPELYHSISSCRICASNRLAHVIDLGMQALTGCFPRANEPDPEKAPLELLRCEECGLVQLRHSVDVNAMFGDNYGYRSGTNATMRNHLGSLAAAMAQRAELVEGDVVLDIGCNDGTLLNSYPQGVRKVGIDPIAGNFAGQYAEDLNIHAGFFSAHDFDRMSPVKRAKAISSISMFYDLESPGDFVKDIAHALDAEGVWVLEQSYLPDMLEQTSFDTICHEHLEYYALSQIEYLADLHGLRVFDVKRNGINGGSFQVWVCHKAAKHAENSAALGELRQLEAQLHLNTDEPFAKFRHSVAELGVKLKDFISTEVGKGKKVYVYGASTKGNVLLQHYEIDQRLVVACAERSPNKWGLRTPGTSIPIVSEDEARAAADYFLVLPWHFRDEFVVREAPYLERGGRFIFPLPKFELVGPS